MSIILFLGILAVLWQGIYWLGVDVLELVKAYSVPSPLGVAQRFVELCSNGALLKATGNSLMRGVTGYLIAVILGILLGLMINHFLSLIHI